MKKFIILTILMIGILTCLLASTQIISYAENVCEGFDIDKSYYFSFEETGSCHTDTDYDYILSLDWSATSKKATTSVTPGVDAITDENRVWAFAKVTYWTGPFWDLEYHIENDYDTKYGTNAVATVDIGSGNIAGTFQNIKNEDCSHDHIVRTGDQ